MKIEGLGTLSRQMTEASDVFQDMNGQLGNVAFDPEDPSSIKAAIQNMDEMIDARTSCFSKNPVIKTLAKQIKEKCRTAILDKAAESRLKKDKKDE